MTLCERMDTRDIRRRSGLGGQRLAVAIGVDTPALRPRLPANALHRLHRARRRPETIHVSSIRDPHAFRRRAIIAEAPSSRIRR